LRGLNERWAHFLFTLLAPIVLPLCPGQNGLDQLIRPLHYDPREDNVVDVGRPGEDWREESREVHDRWEGIVGRETRNRECKEGKKSREFGFDGCWRGMRLRWSRWGVVIVLAILRAASLDILVVFLFFLFFPWAFFFLLVPPLLRVRVIVQLLSIALLILHIFVPSVHLIHETLQPFTDGDHDLPGRGMLADALKEDFGCRVADGCGTGELEG
jgi:hypothetical protein